jgi:hypothetical protein
LEGTLTSGKKWASGTVSVTMNQNRTANTYPYNTDTQENSMMPRMIVTGLKFKPSYVIIFNSEERTNTPASSGFMCIMSPMCNYYWRNNRNVTRYLYSANANVIGITSDGFMSVIPPNVSGGTYWWIAYE